MYKALYIEHILNLPKFKLCRIAKRKTFRHHYDANFIDAAFMIFSSPCSKETCIGQYK